MLLPQRRLTSTWRASRPCQAGFGRCLCRHAVHQLHGGSCCVPYLCPAELCQPSWVHWEDRVRQLPFGQQTHWGEASSGSAPRHHLQDGGWGASQVRQAPPASCWWLQGPHEHWRRNLWKRGKLYSGSRFGLPKPATRVHQLLAAGVSWGQPEQQQPVLGILHRHHLRHRWFEGSKTSQLAPWMAGCAHPYLLHCTVA